MQLWRNCEDQQLRWENLSRRELKAVLKTNVAFMKEWQEKGYLWRARILKFGTSHGSNRANVEEQAVQKRAEWNKNILFITFFLQMFSIICNINWCSNQMRKENKRSWSELDGAKYGILQEKRKRLREQREVSPSSKKTALNIPATNLLPECGSSKTFNLQF